VQAADVFDGPEAIAAFERDCLDATQAIARELFAPRRRPLVRRGLVLRSVALEGSYPDTEVLVLIDGGPEPLALHFPVWVTPARWTPTPRFHATAVRTALYEAT
jgi:hypothetical protein